MPNPEQKSKSDILLTDINEQIKHLDRKIYKELVSNKIQLLNSQKKPYKDVEVFLEENNNKTLAEKYGEGVLQRIEKFEGIRPDIDNPRTLLNHQFPTAKEYTRDARTPLGYNQDIINIVKMISKKHDNDSAYRVFTRRIEQLEVLEKLRQHLLSDNNEAKKIQKFKKDFNRDETKIVLQEESVSFSSMWSKKAGYIKSTIDNLKQYDIEHPTIESEHLEPMLKDITDQLKRVENKIVTKLIADGVFSKNIDDKWQRANSDLIERTIERSEIDGEERHINQYRILKELKRILTTKEPHIALSEVRKVMADQEVMSSITAESVSLSSAWSAKSVFAEKLKSRVAAFDRAYPVVEKDNFENNLQINNQLQENYINPFLTLTTEQLNHVKTKLDKILGFDNFVKGISQTKKYETTIQFENAAGKNTADAERQLVQYKKLEKLIEILNVKVSNNILKIDNFVNEFQKSQQDISKEGINLFQTEKAKYVKSVSNLIKKYEDEKPNLTHDITYKFPKIF